MIEPVLELKGLTKSFGALKVTDGVDLDLRPGEIHALIGPNGAGKSSLIKLVAGELAANSGSIRFDGREINGLDQIARARLGLTRTFQVSSLIPEFSARGNVMLAAQARHRSVFGFVRQVSRDRELTGEAMQALERVGLADRAAVRVSELSHGEKRLLEIAMALAMRPRIFLMDEPMAGLGQEGSSRLIGFLDNLRREAPILLIEHDMDAVFQLADRISVLVAGRIIARGKADEIRTHPEVRAAYLGEDEA
ncbi:branched-chain amino acid ABC transporter substrate-binding protein [Hoeflea sp. BAL378]|uniref:ABC transporter ATP-binding protein n=1 Tax=Hoeflea sp. BAL378 TaxID=1547437 RepID=UPI0005139ADA|nr:ABC transporter ATP-binding protein [Hoeflea sp. BAL378]KGF67840.1 branched-chain amino acid ABC transporter substrate-binding protein [Hoeflea sp. BAL378]